MSDATTDVVIEAAHFDPVTDRPDAPAGTSCRARRRSGSSAASTRPRAGRGAAGGRAAGRSTAAADRRRLPPCVGSPAEREPITIDAAAARPRGRYADRPTTLRSTRCARSAAMVDARRRPHHGDAAAVAARPHRPVRPGRGGRPGRRLRPGAVGAARRTGRPRLDASAAAAPPRRASRWPAPATSRCSATRSSGRVTGTPRAARRRRAPHRPCGWPTRCRRRSRCCARRCCPGCCGRLARNVGRGQTDVALFELGSVFLPGAGGPPEGAAARRRPGARPTTSSAARGRAAGPAAAPRRRRWRAHAEAAGWWGGGRAGSWADAVEAAREVARASGSRSVEAAQRTAVAPGPVRPHPAR